MAGGRGKGREQEGHFLLLFYLPFQTTNNDARSSYEEAKRSRERDALLPFLMFFVQKSNQRVLDSRSADKELNTVKPEKSKACVTTFGKKVGAKYQLLSNSSGPISLR